MTLAIEFLFFVFFFALLILIVWLFSSPKLSLVSAYRFDKLIYKINSHEKAIERVIDQQDPFYKALNVQLRKEFLWRVYYFIKTTEFVIKFEGDQSKIESTIAFTAAQLSLGLSIRCFTQYERVMVYEDDYLSTHSQQYHKGEVHAGAGTILFSWNSILFGLSDHYDGINLLVHEFAHALRLEHKMRGDQYEIFDDDNFMTFEKEAEAVLENIRTVENHFFR